MAEFTGYIGGTTDGIAYATNVDRLTGISSAGVRVGTDPGPPLTGSFRNRVWDTVAGKLVYWLSYGAPDPTGSRYPGPGVFGVSTSNYCIDQAP